MLGSCDTLECQPKFHSQSLNQSMCIVIVWQVLRFKAFVHMVVLHGSMQGRLRAVRLSLAALRRGEWGFRLRFYYIGSEESSVVILR